MECCVSHATLAIFTGIFHMMINMVASVYFHHLYNLEMEMDKDNELNATLSVASFLCIVAVFLSISMVTGVCMKRHKLIQPFLEFGILCFVASGLLWVVIIGSCIWHQEPFTTICFVLTGAILTVGIQILLLLPALFVYKELLVEANGTENECQTNDTTLKRIIQDVYGAKKTLVDSATVV